MFSLEMIYIRRESERDAETEGKIQLNCRRYLSRNINASIHLIQWEKLMFSKYLRWHCMETITQRTHFWMWLNHHVIAIEHQHIWASYYFQKWLWEKKVWVAHQKKKHKKYVNMTELRLNFFRLDSRKKKLMKFCSY